MHSLHGNTFWDWLREEPEHKPVELSLSAEEARIRLRLTFVGQVQGVGFRYVLKEAAQVFELTGSGRNEPDGTVVAELQGAPLAIENAVHYIQYLSPYILVDEIRQEALPIAENETDFVTE